jgi:hypothetical protein
MMGHFGAAVVAIQGNWTYGDNLAEVNRRTKAGESLEDAARQGFTGKRAAEYGFTQVHLLSGTQGSPGCYTAVYVLFAK